MKVLLDECVNSKRLAHGCQEKGRDVQRPPKGMVGTRTKDPAVLEFAAHEGRVLFSSDLQILEEHLEAIPKNHPGIVLVGYSDRVINRSFTEQAMLQIVKIVKASMPGWSRLDLRDSIVVITETNVRVGHVSGTSMAWGDWASWADKDLEFVLGNAIKANARRASK